MSGFKQLVIVGGGGTAADVLSIIECINERAPTYRVLGILDDALEVGSAQHGTVILGGLGSTLDGNFTYVDCLGSPSSYTRRESLLLARGFDSKAFETIIHPSASIARSAEIGAGCIIYPNVVILSGVRLQAHVTVLANSVLNHEASVGAYSILASGVNVSGKVRVGRAAYIGCGASIREGVEIGDGSLVGLGSAVVRDVPVGAVVAGSPARPIRAK